METFNPQTRRDFILSSRPLISLGYLSHVKTIARWNKDLFVSQAATMTELTAVLMNADLEDIRPSVTEDSFLNRATSDIEDQLDAGRKE